VREPKIEREKREAERLRRDGDMLFLCLVSPFILSFLSLFLTINLMGVTVHQNSVMECVG
jgi:hypothetical protein